MFHSRQDPHWLGQVDPVRLGQVIAADSPFERELSAVRVYRGRPDSMRDPKGYAASARQIARWRRSPLVDVTLRTLRYPRLADVARTRRETPREGHRRRAGHRLRADGHEDKYDVGILMSTDTHLKPALEAVAELTRTHGRPRAEVAAWSTSKQHSRRLSITGRKLYCHWLDASSYESAADVTDYSRPDREAPGDGCLR